MTIPQDCEPRLPEATGHWNTPDSPGGDGAAAPELAAALEMALMGVRRDGGASKDEIREAHRAQRRLRYLREKAWLDRIGRKAIGRFAESSEINSRDVRPVVVPIAGTENPDADLFRLATQLWSVPVSRGYGRRMRFLVIDAANEKLIGVFALGDPVFNLRVRDQWIGWDSQDRKKRAASVMDLFVCGAVPPYNSLLCGKLVAALGTSQDVVATFRERYAGSRGIISKEVRQTDLLVVTTTSALGRSSLYNRLHLDTAPATRFERIGLTEGWGHFAVSDGLFRELRAYLSRNDHKYADGHQYGTGPNWRLRTIRAAMDLLGVDVNLLRHGIQREVYASEMTPDARQQLQSGVREGSVQRPSAEEIGRVAVQRWIVPRFERMGLPPVTRDDLAVQLRADGD